MKEFLFFLALGTAIVGVPLLGCIFWMRTRTYRKARRFNFDAKSMHKEGLYLNAPAAHSQLQAFLWVGLPGFVVYVSCLTTLLLRPATTTYLAIGISLLVMYVPVQRIMGTHAARAVARYYNATDDLRATTLQGALAYCREVWRPTNRNYTLLWSRLGTAAVLLGLICAYIGLWPLWMIIAINSNMAYVQTPHYGLPFWRHYHQ